MTRRPEPSVYDVPIPRDEFDALVKRACADLDGEEGRELAALVAWHRRRYPTALDRLRHATRLTRQWLRAPKISTEKIR